MYRLGFLSCIVFVTVSGYVVPEDNISLPKLKWPQKYTFEAEKIYVISGVVEDIKFWKTKTKSRVDYNHGAVKTLSVKAHVLKNYTSGVRYKVHPETTEKKENYLVCKRKKGTDFNEIDLEDILPNVSGFEHVGSETYEQDTVEKFSFTEEDLESSVIETVWAIYNRKNNTWRPFRCEYLKYNTWLGSISNHLIWNFYSYKTDFKSSAVFNFETIYDCIDSEEDDEIYKTQINDIDPENENHVNQVFKSFKEKYNKIYSDTDEHSMRRNIFQDRMRLVLKNNNRKNAGFKLAINEFADRTPEEMKRYLGLIRPSHRETDTHPFPYTKSTVENIARTLPKEYDLRDLGLVTPVKAQESCGSCWTIATAAAVEGALARKNGGRLLRLSYQALLDCAWGFGGSGCDGGNDISAYHWMMAHGLPTEEEYGAYANTEGFCRIHNMTKIYPILGFTDVTPLSVEALKVALVNHGPLSVSIHATDMLFLYNGGIYYDIECKPNKLNHEVTLVGYGQHDGEEYWIVKNSWGQNWGIDGYLYLSARDNDCGITTEPTYVVL